MTKGQHFSQAGFPVGSSGQHDMSPSIPAICSMAVTAALDMLAIARSAATTLTGAINTPTRANNERRCARAGVSFIAFMIVTARECRKVLHGKLWQFRVIKGAPMLLRASQCIDRERRSAAELCRRIGWTSSLDG